jgi:cystathionine gamma-synthase
MSTVTVLSKEPPGGRCSLYMRYAEALHQALGYPNEIRYCDADAAVPPPAMLVGDRLVAPSDGVILSPEDVAGSLPILTGVSGSYRRELATRTPPDDRQLLGRSGRCEGPRRVAALGRERTFTKLKGIEEKRRL